jgi:hypothetical protein
MMAGLKKLHFPSRPEVIRIGKSLKFFHPNVRVRVGAIKKYFW